MKKYAVTALLLSTVVAGIAGFAQAACSPVTSQFPTSLDTFVANNCIPSGWANQLEQAIGITNSTATSSINYLLSHISTSSASIYVDANRTDSYTINGTNLYPYKSLAAAIASSTGYGGYAYNLVPGTYVDGAPDTFTSSPFAITGNESTYIPISGVTFPGSFDIYDLTIVGNVVESDNSLNFIHQFNNSVITGNLTVAGSATLDGMTFPTTTSTVTVLQGAVLDTNGIFSQGILQNNGGFLVINNSSFQASSSNRIVNSTSGQVAINGATLLNFGTGGGLSINNGATSSPNEIVNATIVVNSSSPGSTINAGSAATAICGVVGLTNFQGTFIPPVGTNWQPCYDEDRGVLNYLVTGTSTPPVTTVYNAGSYGSAPVVGSVSTTLTALSPTFQVFTGSSIATATLPLVTSSTGEILTFKNRGTAALSIAATSTNLIWLSGANTSTASYSLSAGSSTAFQNDGQFWDQLWK